MSAFKRHFRSQLGGPLIGAAESVAAAAAAAAAAAPPSAAAAAGGQSLQGMARSDP